MKQISCREMGGTCDEMMKGETAEELGQKGFEHVQSATDEEHKALFAKMGAMSEEEIGGWKKEFQTKFDALPETEAPAPAAEASEEAPADEQDKE